MPAHWGHWDVVLKLENISQMALKQKTTTQSLTEDQDLVFTTQTLVNSHPNWQRCGPLINFFRELKWNDYATPNHLVGAGFGVKRARRVQAMHSHEPTPSCRNVFTLWPTLNAFTNHNICTAECKNISRLLCDSLFEPWGQTCVWMQREFTVNICMCVCVCYNSRVEGEPRGDFR